MKNGRFAKLMVGLNGAVPLALLSWDAAHHVLGANPVNFTIRTTGMLALIFLLLSLAVTPLSRWTGQPWLGEARRPLGLYAFFHTLLHFLLFFGLDREFNLASTLEEVGKRRYLLVGFIALVLMAPLAATSTDRMICRLGAKRWKALHRLAYIAAILGALHYYMLVKSDVRQPLVFAAALGVLLAYRVVAYFIGRRATSGQRALQGAEAATSAPRKWAGRLRVVRTVDETPHVRTFRFAAPDGGELPFTHEPGQFLNITLQVDGKPVRRCYTIASSPTRRDFCEITVKREEMGVASGHLHRAVREGDLIEIAAPGGKFTFTGGEANAVVLIAGGVGVTPMMSKVRYLTDRGWPGTIHLVYCVRTERDIIFRAELDDLARRFPNLRVTITLTGAAGSSWAGGRGRVTSVILKAAAPAIASMPVHVCGPSPMMADVVAMLRELGVPEEQIKTEAFGPASQADAAPSDDASSTRRAGAEIPAEATVTFARSGKTATARAGMTLLEVAEEAGVAIDFDCRAGVCGSCKTRLIAGRVSMEADEALTPEDRAKGVVLACQSHCLGPVTAEA